MPSLSDPKAIVERGEQIYKERYKDQFEREHIGEFVAIDVITEKAYVARTPEKVLDDAKKDAPQGLFHLIQVGQAGAFRVSYSSHAPVDWIFR